MILEQQQLLLSEKMENDGGIIAPGVNLSLGSLYLATANLPKISLKPLIDKNSTIIGKNA